MTITFPLWSTGHMTREQFDAFRAGVRARGFDAVKTLDGHKPLETVAALRCLRRQQTLRG